MFPAGPDITLYRVSNPSTVLDLELTVRVGALSAAAGTEIERAATTAFLWRGLGQSAALDVARGLQWLALGQPADCPAATMIAVLALRPLSAERCRVLGQAVDDVLALDREPPDHEQCAAIRVPRVLGRRLSVALTVLVGEERRARA